jgi:hypothetical protein
VKAFVRGDTRWPYVQTVLFPLLDNGGSGSGTIAGRHRNAHVLRYIGITVIHIVRFYGNTVCSVQQSRFLFLLQVRTIVDDCEIKEILVMGNELM